MSGCVRIAARPMIATDSMLGWKRILAIVRHTSDCRACSPPSASPPTTRNCGRFVKSRALSNVAPPAVTEIATSAVAAGIAAVTVTVGVLSWHGSPAPHVSPITAVATVRPPNPITDALMTAATEPHRLTA